MAEERWGLYVDPGLWACTEDARLEFLSESSAQLAAEIVNAPRYLNGWTPYEAKLIVNDPSGHPIATQRAIL